MLIVDLYTFEHTWWLAVADPDRFHGFHGTPLSHKNTLEINFPASNSA